jgi:endonuclease/exonuclease/phosphatase family metal-dependent hydrolase
LSHAPALSRRSSAPAVAGPVIVAMLVLALLLPGWAAGKQAVHGHAAVAGAAAAHDRGKGKVVNVMTRNLYLGANLMPAIEAPSLEALAAANGEILREVVDNDFPIRAEGLADEILEQKPDLVGLQEVSLWQTTPLSPAATSVNFDYLDLLLDELNQGKGKNGKGKQQYRVVVVQEEFDLESPADFNELPGDGPLPGFENAELLGHLTMRDVILARNGAGVQTWNEQGDNFDALQEIEILGNVLFIDRGWTAADAKVRGSHPFRFVNTHLEAFHPIVRLEQAEELVAPGGPATSELPVVLLGDLNSDDDTVVFPDTLAYDALLGAGMVSRSTGNPLSCCIEKSRLAVSEGGSVDDFDHQVDHVLTRDPAQVTLQSSTVTGRLPVNGFWSSDHAGVFSALRFTR